MTFAAGNGFLRAACAAALGLALAAPAAPPNARKLNGPLPRLHSADVRDFLLAPDGKHVVYVADQDADETFELYAGELTRGARSVRLHPPLPVPQDVERFLVDERGHRAVFFIRNPSFSGLFYVLSTPLDGSAAPLLIVSSFLGMPERVELTHDGSRLLYVSRSEFPVKIYSLPVDRVAPAAVVNLQTGSGLFITDLRQTPDGEHVVFVSESLIGRHDLFCSPVDGSSPAVPLNTGNVIGVSGFELTPDGASVVFRAQNTTTAEQSLYLAPLDGSVRPVRLTPDLPGIREVEDFALTSDGTRVVYRADHETQLLPELFSLALAAPSAPVKLSGPLVAGGAIQPGFALTPDGRHVVYLADQEVDERVELFAVPIDGSAPPVRLHAPFGPDEEITRFALAADGAHAVFTKRSDQVELFSALLDGSGAVRLHPPLVAGGDVVNFELAGESVVYRADAELDKVLELFGARADGTAPPRRLHAPLPPGRGVLPTLRFAPDQRSVAFLADLDEQGTFELFRVPLDAPVDGSAPTERLSDPAVGNGLPVGDVLAALPAGESVVYLADQRTDEVFELYSVPRDGSLAPQRLHRPPVEGGDVLDFEVGADGRRVLFAGDLEVDGRRDLYSVPSDASSAPVALVGPLVAGGSIRERAVSPDSAWVVYRADALRYGQVELFSVPFDGSAPPRRLDPAPHDAFGNARWFSVTPDSRRVLYGSDKDRRGRVELWSVPIDGSAAALRLSAVTAPGGDVLEARASADSAWVVYRADQDVNDVFEVYSAPAAGGAPPRKLHASLVGVDDAGRFELDERNHAVFPLGPPGVRELFHAPLDASAPASRFFPSGTQTLQFWTTPRGTRVLAKARATHDADVGLYSAPADGSATPVLVAGPLHEFEDIHHLLFPDEETVLYADPTLDATMRVPLDGSAAPRAIDRSALGVQLSADGSLLLSFGSSSSPSPDPNVYVVPSDGSAPARRIGPPFLAGGFVRWARFAAQNDVLVLAVRERAGPQELYVSGAPFLPGRADARR